MIAMQVKPIPGLGRTLAGIAIGIAAIVATAACIASVACGVVAIVAIGAAASAAGYAAATAGTKEFSPQGLVGSAALGGALGAIPGAGAAIARLLPAFKSIAASTSSSVSTVARAEASVAAKVGTAACFVAGTPILLADGTTKPVEKIVPGDRVVAYNTSTGSNEAREVVRTFVHHGVETFVVRLESGESVTTTSEHPFWVEGRGWIAADELLPGDHLREANGATSQVLGLGPTGRSATVYNFEVQDLHNYYVQAGETWILVHNTCDMDVDGLVHVASRHTISGAERDGAASVFDEGVDLAALAQGSAGQIGTRNAVTGRIEYVIQARGIVGTTGGTNGLPTSVYTVVRNPFGELTTMYPGR